MNVQLSSLYKRERILTVIIAALTIVCIFEFAVLMNANASIKRYKIAKTKADGANIKVDPYNVGYLDCLVTVAERLHR